MTDSEGANGTRVSKSWSGRALLTDRQREVFRSGDHDSSTEFVEKTRSQLRRRIREELATDLEILREGFPEGYRLLYEVVADEWPLDFSEDAKDADGSTIVDHATLTEAEAEEGASLAICRSGEEAGPPETMAAAEPGDYYLVRVESGE